MDDNAAEKLANAQAGEALSRWNDAHLAAHGWTRIRRRSDYKGAAPYLYVPGSRLFSIYPDGLYGCFGQDEDKAIEYVDILAIEVCGSTQNFYDKRARYAEQNPLGLFCQPTWLKYATFIEGNPYTEVQNIPVRYRAILFAVSSKLFESARQCVSPWGNEYFVPFSNLDKCAEWIASVASPTSRFFWPR